jgi:two-component system NtrC family response regulator
MAESVKPKVLVVDDELSICRSCEKVLVRRGFEVEIAPSGREALNLLRKTPFDLVLTDLRMLGMGGMELLENLRTSYPDVVAVVITGYATVASVVETMKLGAYDYLPKPFTAQELANVAEKAWEHRKLILERNALLKGEATPHFAGIIGNSPKMQEVFRLIKKVAVADTTVLIMGESGTGKELVAQAIHAQSPRKQRRFLAVDCGVLSTELLQSELFGHVKGAFTGAVSAKPGIFEVADRGTVFLDEICNVSLEVQAKLLRFIQSREFLPLGGTDPKRVDVRLVFATNRDLAKMVEAGAFREDLYYRLYVVPIHLPSLRERKEDIPLLAYHFLGKVQAGSGRKVTTISDAALKLLQDFNWPGNVRQLENTVEWAVITCEKETIEPQHLPRSVAQEGLPPGVAVPQTNAELLSAKRTLRDQVVGDLERVFVLRALERNDWNISRAARDVGMQRQNFQALMRKHQVQTERS